MSAVDTSQVALQTVLQTAEAVAPAVLAAGAVADPKVAVAMQLATIAVPMLQQAQQLVAAGAMTPAQLATLWAQVGAGVQKAHNDWEAMNVPTMPAAQPAAVAPATPATTLA